MDSGKEPFQARHWFSHRDRAPATWVVWRLSRLESRRATAGVPLHGTDQAQPGPTDSLRADPGAVPVRRADWRHAAGACQDQPVGHLHRSRAGSVPFAIWSICQSPWCCRPWTRRNLMGRAQNPILPRAGKPILWGRLRDHILQARCCELMYHIGRAAVAHVRIGPKSPGPLTAEGR